MLFAMAIVMLLYTGAATDDLLTALVVYGGLIIGMFAAFWYSNRLSSGIAGALLGGGSGGKTDPTVARADALVSERKYDDAIGLYLQAIAKNKKNPAPRLKLADLYFRLRDYDNCLKCIEQAVRMRKGLSDDERCSRLNRLADIYLQQKRDRASAIKALQLIVKDYPKSKSAVFARERIKQISGVLSP
jgi:tetratricopeptide (TPR) repeat protein